LKASEYLEGAMHRLHAKAKSKIYAKNNGPDCSKVQFSLALTAQDGKLGSFSLT
jgi:hypothetical protein